MIKIESPNYSISKDYISRWLEIVSMKNEITETIIQILKLIFNRIGIVKESICDNNLCCSKKLTDDGSQMVSQKNQLA